MTEFTPGPWTKEYDNHGNGSFSEWYDIGTKKNRVAQVHLPRRHSPAADTAKADASLIAAAPDLYAALDYFVSEYGEPDEHDQVGRAVYQKAIAALAKARGETS